MAQWVKDPELSLLELLLWCGFDPWPRNFHMPVEAPQKKKKKRKEKRKRNNYSAMRGKKQNKKNRTKTLNILSHSFHLPWKALL